MSMMRWGNMMSYGVKGNYGYGFGYWSFLNISYTILLIGLIILVFLGITKLWRGLYQKKDKK